MDLRRLTHFIALAEEGRFAPAAARVHLSQAAFSRSIQALEERAGMALIDRGPHGITLTQAGEVVLRRARELVFDSSCLQRDLDLMKSGDAGELVIGAGPVPAATLVPELLIRLRKQSPLVVNRLRFGKLPQLLSQLDAQQVDVCLGDPRQMLRNEHYAMQPVSKLYGGMYCRAGHPLLRRGIINADTLTQYGIALISASPVLMDSLATDYGFTSGARVPVVVECDDLSLLARLITETDVVGLLPDAIAQRAGKKLRKLTTPGASLVFADVHAIWLKDRTLSLAAQRAIALAQDIGTSLAQSSQKP
jgi:DNA-binding transcriptional LysR family regulator